MFMHNFLFFKTYHTVVLSLFMMISWGLTISDHAVLLDALCPRARPEPVGQGLPQVVGEGVHDVSRRSGPCAGFNRACQGVLLLF